MKAPKIAMLIFFLFGIGALLIKAYAPIPPTVASRIPFAPATKVPPYTPARKIDFLHGYD
jgi:hypothetical protein